MPILFSFYIVMPFDEKSETAQSHCMDNKKAADWNQSAAFLLS